MIQDLTLPAHIVEKLNVKRTSDELLLFIKSITDLEYPDTFLLAGRLLVQLHMKTCPDNMEQYLEALDGILSTKQKQFITTHIQTLNDMLKDTYDKNFIYDLISATKMQDYALKFSHGDHPIETPCQTILRVIIQIFGDCGIDTVEKMYYFYLKNTITNATPTMNNSGTKKHQLSSCFLAEPGDCIEDLNDMQSEISIISKLQGAVGVSLSKVRHSQIGNQGKSKGPLKFAEIFDKTVECVDQGGSRPGAATFTLHVWHLDIWEFIESRDLNFKNGSKFEQANTSIFFNSLFFERVRKGEEWTTFCPNRAYLKDGRTIHDKYGYEFEEIYVELEKEALEKEREYNEFCKEFDEFDIYVNSHPDDKEAKIKYFQMHHKKHYLSKHLIIYKKYSAEELYKHLCEMHLSSSMPYVMHSDYVNTKCNMMNTGMVNTSNLCQEITLPANSQEIASCNLSHINLKALFKKKLTDIPFKLFKDMNQGIKNTANMGGYGAFKDFDNQHIYNRVYSVEDIRECIDFNLLGETMRVAVRSITNIIKNTYYPLDVYPKDDSEEIKRGKISKLNLKNYPLGIGVSGLGDLLMKLDVSYESPTAILINKMIFACMYYNGLQESHTLALEEGAYDNFWSGKSKLFIDGKWEEVDGSPLANGMFQFDLWKMEAQYYDSIGRLNKDRYFIEDDQPILPHEWGGDGSWRSLRHKIMKDGVRNSMLIALMPTASSAQRFGQNSECMETHQSLLYSRNLVTGNFICFPDHFMKDMQSWGLWNKKTINYLKLNEGSLKGFPEYYDKNYTQYHKERLDGGILRHLEDKYKCMFDINVKTCMQMSRQRGIYIDHTQSFNIYVDHPTVEKMTKIHDYGEQLHLKTGMYYLRQKQSTQNDQFTVSLSDRNSLKETSDRQSIKEEGSKHTMYIEEKFVCTRQAGCTSCE